VESRETTTVKSETTTVKSETTNAALGFKYQNGTTHPMSSETPAPPADSSLRSSNDSESSVTSSEHAGNDSEGRDLVAFSDLARASYCPRQLYYTRRGDRDVPEEVVDAMELAYRYPELRRMNDSELAAEPIELPPDAFRERLAELERRPEWPALAEPPARDVYLAGKDCHGIAYKLLPGEAVAADTEVKSEATDETPNPPPVPTLVSPGTPPEQGVWEPQSVRAVAAAKALAWEREREIPRAFVEYPTHATVRTVRLTVRKTAAYRRALRTARGIDAPPPRLRNSAKCEPCEFREECGVKTRSLRNRLGL
jgi:CRISPR-associated exonuclease Cas4